MIGILGAGSLGRLWAATLPVGRVAFIARPDEPTGTDLSYRFRPVTGPETTIRIPFVGPGDEPGLILVTTKAGDTVDAISGVINRLPGATPILLFQNGLGSQQAVAAQWPHHPILAASTTEGANRPDPDLLVHAGSGDTWIGAMTDPARACVDNVIAMFQATGLKVHREPDILQRLWQKLIINAGINPYTAILDCPNGEILASALYQSTIDDLCGELSRLMAGAGQGEKSPEALRHRIEQVARNTAGNTSSMRADVLHHRRTEIDFINGYLARLGNELGIETPVNQMLTERVQQLSSP